MSDPRDADPRDADGRRADETPPGAPPEPSGDDAFGPPGEDLPGEAPPGEESAARSWRRLGRAAGWRPTRSGVAIALLAVLLGIMVSTQIGQTRQLGLEGLRQSELVSVLDSVNQRSARLDEEVARLTDQRDRLQREQGLDPEQARAAAVERADALGIAAGTVAARGPGVRITITDPGRTVGASTILDAVQELRDAGAEAIQIGDVRVIASSAVTDDATGGVAVDGTALPDPYAILAIGDPQTMASAMAIPGGVVETVRGLGATIQVGPSQDVRITALHPLQAPRYARPESSPTPS